MLPAGLEWRDGWAWPAADKIGFPWVMSTLDDAMRAVALCRERRVAVQAGGNCGVWPRLFAEHFDRVYTFEPDALNFAALAINCAHLPNVYAFRAAVGSEACAWASVGGAARNCLAYQTTDGGPVPVLAIDSLMLDACDLIQLDVEGREPTALAGASATLDAYRPVLMVEDKGLGDMAAGWSQQFRPGLYRVAERVNRDTILCAS